MPVRWLVDPEAVTALWRELIEMPLRLGGGPGRTIADLGGGGGSFVGPLAATGARLVTVDADLAILHLARPHVKPIGGALQRLPFRDASLDAAAGRAILHHTPEDLDTALREVRRVVKRGGLVLFEEPTSGNVLANAARRRFPTERHDPRERPLPYEAYVSALRRHFEVIEARPHFLLSYLLPHLVPRLPPNRRPFVRALARLAARWDRRALDALPGLRSQAAYISVLARRP